MKMRRDIGGYGTRHGARAARGTLLAGVLAVTTLPLAGCELLIPDVTHEQPGSGGPLVVKDGRLGTLHLVVAGAGSVRVLDTAMDTGDAACSGDGDHRMCVRGGLTARGKD